MAEECFIALSGLEEGFGEEKMVVAQGSQEEEQMLEGEFFRSWNLYFSDHEACIYLFLQTVFLQKDGDLHTPLQSPQPAANPIHQDKDILDTLDPTAIADGNYFQCDLCHISCTDSEYLKRHR